MRKLLFKLIAISFAAIANAQIYAGGSLSLKTNSDAESTSISIAPEVGYVLNDKFSVGAALGLYTHSYKGYGSSNVLSIKPYVRYIAPGWTCESLHRRRFHLHEAEGL